MRVSFLILILVAISISAIGAAVDLLDAHYIRKRIPSPVNTGRLLVSEGRAECGVRIFSVNGQTIEKIRINGVDALNVSGNTNKWKPTPVTSKDNIQQHLGGLSCAYGGKLKNPITKTLEDNDNYFFIISDAIIILNVNEATIAYVYMD